MIGIIFESCELYHLYPSLSKCASMISPMMIYSQL